MSLVDIWLEAYCRLVEYGVFVQRTCECVPVLP